MKNFFLLVLVFFFTVAAGAKECRVGYLAVNLTDSYPKPMVTRYDNSVKMIVGSTLRENRSQSFISIMETYINKYPEKSREELLKLDPEKELAPFLAKKKFNYDSFETTEVSTQKFAGYTFVKVVWSGLQKGSTVKMRGLYFVVRDGDIVYELNYVDYDDYFDLCAPEVISIFNSLSR